MTSLLAVVEAILLTTFGYCADIVIEENQGKSNDIVRVYLPTYGDDAAGLVRDEKCQQNADIRIKKIYQFNAYQ